MIKWDGFGKSLKQLFSIGLISCFILLGNFSDSEWIVRDNGNYGYSTIDTSIDLNVANKGQLMSQRFGNTQRMLAFASSENSRIYFWWSFNQKPYYFVNYAGHKMQGYLKNYQLCDEIYFTGGVANISNCTLHTITDNFAVEVGGLFQSMTINDLWAYNIYTWNCYGSAQLVNKVCFSSSEYGKSICFSAGAGNDTVCGCPDCFNLQDSLGFDFDRDFTSINAVYLNTPPGFTPVSSGVLSDMHGSSEVNTDNILTGDYLYSTCSKLDIIEYLHTQGFNKYLCYGGLDNFSHYQTGFDYNPIPGSGVVLSYLIQYSYGDFSSNTDWFNYFNGLRTRCINNGEIYCNKWTNYPAIYKFWFDFYYEYGGAGIGINKLIEYCDLINSSDYYSDYTGSVFSNQCNNVITQRNNSINDFGGDYLQGANWNGVGIMSGSIAVQTDPLMFIQNFFNKVKQYIKTDYSFLNLGFLPQYIISFLLALILFRFIMH